MVRSDLFVSFVEESAVEAESAVGLVELTTRIVSAYVSNNTVQASDVPALIVDTHAVLSRIRFSKSTRPISRLP